MKTPPVVIEAPYENDKVDTLGKLYSVCVMTFSPHSGEDYVFGTTCEVMAYWNSLTSSFDFNWLLFDTEEEMILHMKWIDNIYSDCQSISFFRAGDCLLDETPPVGKMVNISSL